MIHSHLIPHHDLEGPHIVWCELVPDEGGIFPCVFQDKTGDGPGFLVGLALHEHLWEGLLLVSRGPPSEGSVGAEVHDCDTLLVSEKKKGELVIVKAWDKPQTQRVVAVARILDYSYHLLMLSINNVHVEIHIEARCDMVAPELDGRLYVLLLEIHFIRIDGDSDLPNV